MARKPRQTPGKAKVSARPRVAGVSRGAGSILFPEKKAKKTKAQLPPARSNTATRNLGGLTRPVGGTKTPRAKLRAGKAKVSTVPRIRKPKALPKKRRG